MAEGGKRKRLEKTNKPVVGDPIFPNARFYCSRCGTSYSRQKGFFPVSHSPMYRGAGYLPICSKCVDEMYEMYFKKFGNAKDAMKHMCMKLDLYWSEKLYEAAEKTAGVTSRMRAYIIKTNLVSYSDKTYDDTLEEEAQGLAYVSASQPDLTDSKTDPAQEPEPVIEVSQEIKDFWGPGFTPEMYLELDERYRYWMSRYPDDSKPDIGEEAIIRQICNLEIDINHKRVGGEAIDKSVNALNTLLGSANLKPAQKDKSSDTDFDNAPLGVLIKKWEMTRPIPEPDPELQDVDGIKKYITVWFFGHLCKMLGLNNSYSRLYTDEIEKLRVDRPEDEFDDDELLYEAFSESDSDDTEWGGE